MKTGLKIKTSREQMVLIGGRLWLRKEIRSDNMLTVRWCEAKLVPPSTLCEAGMLALNLALLVLRR